MALLNMYAIDPSLYSSDDDVLLQLSQGTRIGEIEISCQTVEVEAEVETLNDNPKYENTFIENHKVHERACKGLEEHIGCVWMILYNSCYPTVFQVQGRKACQKYTL
jgi:hypothetical protein